VAVNCAVAEVTTEALVAFRRNATGEGNCGFELEGELAQPPSSQASVASGVTARKKLRQENLDMTRKPQRWTLQNRILVHSAHPGILLRK
jgi:hypothetical protein